ncbi:MAG: hypothetical protein HQK53_00310, partial [Oligoflexia bacterium]|nr:hypothetical protein [Oligoflexia bacterium]
KMGNHYVRTTIIEANQYSFMPVKVSRWLTKRRMEINPKYIEIADRCMHRQSEKGRRLLARGKIRNKAKVACAREMVGFIWESLVKATDGSSSSFEKNFKED